MLDDDDVLLVLLLPLLHVRLHICNHGTCRRDLVYDVLDGLLHRAHGLMGPFFFHGSYGPYGMGPMGSMGTSMGQMGRPGFIFGTKTGALNLGNKSVC